MKTLLRELNWFTVLGCALVVSGCAHLGPVTAGKTIRGLHADQVTVIVPKAVIGRNQDLRLDMQPGTCTPYASNDQGVFYKSDKPVFIRSWVVLVPKTVDGGVFVPNDASKPCKPFYVYEGTPFPAQKAQEPVNVTLVDSATKKRVTAVLE
jgi:hypothetical protein